MIRYAKKEDISVLTEIEKELFPVNPWDENQFLYELEENPFAMIFVDERKDKIVGYVDLWIQYEQAQIANIAVVKEKQSEGIGDHLLKTAIQAAVEYGCENVSLEVRVSNANAIALYEKNDFIEVSIRKNYYEDGEDAKLMVKPIGGLKEYDEDSSN